MLQNCSFPNLQIHFLASQTCDHSQLGENSVSKRQVSLSAQNHCVSVPSMWRFLFEWIVGNILVSIHLLSKVQTHFSQIFHLSKSLAPRKVCELWIRTTSTKTCELKLVNVYLPSQLHQANTELTNLVLLRLKLLSRRADLTLPSKSFLIWEESSLYHAETFSKHILFKYRTAFHIFDTFSANCSDIASILL